MIINKSNETSKIVMITIKHYQMDKISGLNDSEGVDMPLCKLTKPNQIKSGESTSGLMSQLSETW